MSRQNNHISHGDFSENPESGTITETTVFSWKTSCFERLVPVLIIDSGPHRDMLAQSVWFLCIQHILTPEHTHTHTHSDISFRELDQTRDNLGTVHNFSVSINSCCFFVLWFSLNINLGCFSDGETRLMSVFILRSSSLQRSGAPCIIYCFWWPTVDCE